MEISKEDLVELKDLVIAKDKEKIGDIEGALTYYLKVLGDNPFCLEARLKAASLFMNRGTYSLQDGDFSSAERFIKKAMILCPDVTLAPIALYNLAVMYLAKGDYKKGKKMCQRFLVSFVNHNLTDKITDIMLELMDDGK